MKLSGKVNPPGLTAALRARRLEKREPTERDRPPPQPFPGPRRKPLPGQMTLEETTDDAA
jgi:hypothetical protein